MYWWALALKHRLQVIHTQFLGWRAWKKKLAKEETKIYKNGQLRIANNSTYFLISTIVTYFLTSSNSTMSSVAINTKRKQKKFLIMNVTYILARFMLQSDIKEPWGVLSLKEHIRKY